MSSVAVSVSVSVWCKKATDIPGYFFQGRNGLGEFGSPQQMITVNTSAEYQHLSARLTRLSF